MYVIVQVITHLDYYYKSQDSKDGDSIPGSKTYTTLALQAVFRCIASAYSMGVNSHLFTRVISRYTFILELPPLMQERIQRAFLFENNEGD